MKRLIAVVAFLFGAASARAQITTVSGTVKDANGIAYAGASIKAQLVTTAGSPVSGQPTVTINNQAQCLSGGFGSAPCQMPFQGTVGPFALSGTGTFTVNLQDNTQVTPSSTQWLFTVNTQGNPPPIGTGPQLCTAQLTISGASQSVSSSFSACPALSNSAGGGVTGEQPPVIVQSGLLAQYQILATDSPASLIDSSVNGNNATGTVGTAPTIIPVTGGLNCGAAGAVILPSALNSAKTIQIFVSGTTANVRGNYSPIFGNGNGAANGGTGIVLYGTTGLPIYYRIKTVANNAALSVYKHFFVGQDVISFLMDTNDRVFVGYKDEELLFSQGGSSSGSQTTGQYQLCGSATGGSSFTTNYFAGNIYYAVFYSRVLTNAEVAQNVTAIRAAMTYRGVNAGAPGQIVNGTKIQTPNVTNNVFVADGDSQTFGTGIAAPYSTVLTLPTPNSIGTWSTYNQGLAGEKLADATISCGGCGVGTGGLISNADLDVDPLFSPPTLNFIHLWTGTNDGGPAAAIWANMVQYATDRHARGWKVGIMDMISRTGLDTQKNNLDAIVRQNWNGVFDSFTDIAADPNIGADGANANAVYIQSDLTHPTQTTVYNIIAPMTSRTVGRLFGAHDFSAASVYSSAAAAATATTALSESGNTVTVTFAATPANCQVGNVITIAGVTPAGYNSTTANGSSSAGTFYILTRSATQVTYFDATSGLGAATVQGTGVCPMQQPQDAYMVVNFGAGNVTLDTCAGFTGQNINIRNINAAASTLVPLGTETITGTAAPTTLAANTTAILQSQLVSSSAAGCNWVRIQ